MSTQGVSFKIWLNMKFACWDEIFGSMCLHMFKQCACWGIIFGSICWFFPPLHCHKFMKRLLRVILVLSSQLGITMFLGRARVTLCLPCLSIRGQNPSISCEEIWSMSSDTCGCYQRTWNNLQITVVMFTNKANISSFQYVCIMYYCLTNHFGVPFWTHSFQICFPCSQPGCAM